MAEQEAILRANAEDYEEARASGKGEAILDRLLLTRAG
jgi:gamma-glutamyl phosphate reductase